MVRTPAQIADKFANEWLDAKADAIINYGNVANSLAQRAINAKEKMIANFDAVMATTKFEDRLQPYVGTALMENAYTQALDAKIAITEAEKLKVEKDVTLKRALASNIVSTLEIYKTNDVQGTVTVPPNVSDQGLSAMLIQGINANQYGLSADSTPQEIYEETSVYMNTFLGWPLVA